MTTTTIESTTSPFPGSFPEEPASQQQNNESTTLLDTAKTYLPDPDDVQRAMTSVGQAAKAYLPQSVAAYLPSASSSSLETDPDLAPPHPPFLADLPVTGDSGLRTLSTEAQAGSLLPPRVDSTSTSLSDADLGHLSTPAHISAAASPHPVPPLSPADTDPNVEQGGVATLAESPVQLSSLSLSAPNAQNEGPSAPQNSLATPSLGGSTSSPTRTQLDDTPPAPAPPPTGNDRSVPVLAPSALPGASLPSRARGSTPRPGSADSKFVEGIPSPMPAPAAAEPSPIAQTEGLQNPMESATPPPNTPAVPGSLPINPGLGSANGAPDVVAPPAPQGHIAPRDGAAQGKDAPLPLDAPHFHVIDSSAASENTETAPPVPPKTDSPVLAPSAVASPPLSRLLPPPPLATTRARTRIRARALARTLQTTPPPGKRQRRKKPKLLQRLKDKMHVGHAHAHA
ncbi:hypothetical protein MVEN_01981300 [Mycena venus]|uniref:Uncharacterized protein n=1 Tax=Mycena venus TaxID=2733690 RepID=A0A8H6XEE5_9AGAR|nr:hypothetical protein MVEN_01981300 [Mycena venus]